ncbi:MAG: adenine phosphoribosyltransferase [Christensenellaceae bacterium]|jgi:adenine phosphoribosyltransferase|nr:adenine phosphoribosyltransferase [Christensenellaceae bacterium]
MDLAKTIRDVPDFPKKGILFKDVTTLFRDAEAFRALIDGMDAELTQRGVEFDLVAAPEARGFAIGAALAYKRGTGFVPVRKPGKLPAKTIARAYALEYGEGTLEMHEDAIAPGQRVLVIDDILATGGTALAACELIQALGGLVAAVRFAVELKGLGGREALTGYDVDALLSFEVDE